MNVTKQIEKYVSPLLGKKTVICLTGPMAAGKNFVCEQMEKLGYISIDLDKEVHKVIEEQTDKIFETFESIAKAQGISIRTSDDKLDRRALGALLFTSPLLLEKQESIIYPALTENVLNFIKEKNEAKENRPKAVILNATVLYKIPKLMKKCDFIVYVHANWLKRFTRARKRDKMNELQILQRFTAQKDLLSNYKKSEKKILIIKN